MPPEGRIAHADATDGIDARSELIVKRIVEGADAPLAGIVANAAAQLAALQNDPVGLVSVVGADSGGEGYVHGLRLVDVPADDGGQIAGGAKVHDVGFAHGVVRSGRKGHSDAFSGHRCESTYIQHENIRTW